MLMEDMPSISGPIVTTGIAWCSRFKLSRITSAGPSSTRPPVSATPSGRCSNKRRIIWSFVMVPGVWQKTSSA